MKIRMVETCLLFTEIEYSETFYSKKIIIKFYNSKILGNKRFHCDNLIIHPLNQILITILNRTLLPLSVVDIRLHKLLPIFLSFILGQILTYETSRRGGGQSPLPVN